MTESPPPEAGRGIGKIAGGVLQMEVCYMSDLTQNF